MLQVGLRLFPVAAATYAVSVSELVHGAFHSGTHRVSGLPVGRLLSCADAQLQVEELSWRKADVAIEAFVAVVLAGGVARQWSGDGDLMLPGGVFQVDQGGVTTIDEVLSGQQTAAFQPGVDGGQGLRIACRGRGGGHVGDHVGDHVGALRRAGFGEMGQESRPSGGLSPACVAGGGVVGRDDRAGGGRQPALVVGAPAQAARRVAVVVLHDDLPQRLDTGTERVAPPVRVEMLQ
jgi:hypothetical protein